MIKHHAFTPARYHLGDLINIVQQCMTMNHVILGSTHTCSCCGNDVHDTLVQLLSLMQSNIIVLKEDLHPSQIICPTWSRETFGLPQAKNPNYTKSFMATNQSKSKFFSYQFDARSTPKNRTKTIDETQKSILFESGETLIDVGEKSGLTIAQKFDVLNRSAGYIGIDSGVTHLALMTNTPIYMIHPPGEQNNPQQFYPATDQICIYDNMSRLLRDL